MSRLKYDIISRHTDFPGASEGRGAKLSRSDYSEIRSGRGLLLAAMLGTGLGLPTLPYYSIGIFAPILAKTFGWSFASIFGGLGVVSVVLLFGGPLVGYFVDRFGPRHVAAISLCGLGISYMTLAFSTGSLIQYYASWFVIAVAGTGATIISFTRAVSGAFLVRRGLALGITLAGLGLFAFCVKPLAGWLIAVVGWRGAIIAIGLLPLVVGAPAILLGFPSAPTGSIGGQLRDAHSAAPITGLSVRGAVQTRAFWMLFLAFIPISLASLSPLPNMENILRSVRIGPQDTLALASLIGIMMVAGRLIGGWLIDRFWAPLVGAIFLCAGAVGCWVLSQHAVSYREAMLAMVLLGFSAGVEGDLMSYLVTRYIGFRSYGVIYGTLFGVFSIGGGFGPSLLGYIYDRTGSYTQIMSACALLLLFAAGVLINLGRYSNEVQALQTEERS